MVLKRLIRYGFVAKLPKCVFGAKSVEYIGYIVSFQSVRAKGDKVECIKNFVPPKDVGQVRSFLGMTEYYRRFIDNFAKIAQR